VFLALLLAAPLAAQSYSFTISIDPVTVPYDPATGIGSATATIRIVQDPGDPVADTQGLAMYYSHDPAIFHTASIEFAGPIAELDGGTGPPLGNTVAFPDGATSGSVYSVLPPLVTIPYPFPTPIFEVVFETNPAPWIGNVVGGSANSSTDHPVAPPSQMIEGLAGRATTSPGPSPRSSSSRSAIRSSAATRMATAR